VVGVYRGIVECRNEEGPGGERRHKEHIEHKDDPTRLVGGEVWVKRRSCGPGRCQAESRQGGIAGAATRETSENEAQALVGRCGTRPLLLHSGRLRSAASGGR